MLNQWCNNSNRTKHIVVEWALCYKARLEECLKAQRIIIMFNLSCLKMLKFKAELHRVMDLQIQAIDLLVSFKSSLLTVVGQLSNNKTRQDNRSNLLKLPLLCLNMRFLLKSWLISSLKLINRKLVTLVTRNPKLICPFPWSLMETIPTIIPLKPPTLKVL